MLTFRTSEEKAITVWALVVSKQPMSYFDLAKILYLADKEHFNDWGRPIYGENYLATPNGPVPITLKNYIDGNFAFSPNLLKNKYSFTVSDLYIQVNMKPDMDSFSKSDIMALEDAMDKVLVKKEDLDSEFLDSAWYNTPMHSLIDWAKISNKLLTPEQIDDLHFMSMHSPQ